jgi:undecaprenyl-diphosphatase
MTPETINTALFNAIWGLSHKNELLDAVGVLLAQYLPYLMILGAIFFLFNIKERRSRTFFFIEAALAIVVSRGIIAESIYFFYHHPRPFAAIGFDPLISESGYSFPSGHATVFFALAAVLFLFNREWGILYYILASINGVARIYVGVHWPFDVIGGALIGIITASAVHLLLRRYREGARENQHSPLS